MVNVRMATLMGLPSLGASAEVQAHAEALAGRRIAIGGDGLFAFEALVVTGVRSFSFLDLKSL
jgi:hypothetical protein